MQSVALSNKNTKKRLIQRVLWSPLGMHVVRAGRKFTRRWEAVVLNRSVAANLNGENWIPKLLPAAPSVLDVGFHRGEFAHEVLRLRPAARVVGFEPARSMRELYATLHDPDPRIRIESIALSDRAGEAMFHDDSSGLNSLAPIAHSERTISYTVPTLSLDEYAAQSGLDKIDLLKIDVEGYDLHVLEGARELLDRQAIEIFLFEYNATWVLTRRFLRDACDFFADKRYRLFELYNGFLAPFEYNISAERFDSPMMYVGVSEKRLALADVPIRAFPE